MKRRLKVFVGMSGGVDSSVSAALLKEQGYDVTGVFIKVWQPDWIECTAKEDRLDAMRVAATLDIPFVDVNLETEYKKKVIDYMIKEYASGRTPNPDVMCNTFVKFGAFYDWAISNGADLVATGHYARIKRDENRDFGLFAGLDPEKDQSYFLWGIKKDQLSKIIFPVGEYRKEKVRMLARKFKLPTAQKKDSQGLCFIGKIDTKEFLKHFIPTKPGKILDMSGREIGTHPGAILFTIGERHGFSVAQKGDSSAPMYVVAKDISRNTITVSEKLPAWEGSSSSVRLSSVNWTADFGRKKAEARIRYRAPLTPTVLSKKNSVWQAEFPQKILNVASGQSLVAYDGERCLGGGIIQ